MLFRSASGDVSVRQVETVATIRTASGDIRIRRFGHQMNANIRTTSGDVRDA